MDKRYVVWFDFDVTLRRISYIKTDPGITALFMPITTAAAQQVPMTQRMVMSKNSK